MSATEGKHAGLQGSTPQGNSIPGGEACGCTGDRVGGWEETVREAQSGGALARKNPTCTWNQNTRATGVSAHRKWVLAHRKWALAGGARTQEVEAGDTQEPDRKDN